MRKIRTIDDRIEVIFPLILENYKICLECDKTGFLKIWGKFNDINGKEQSCIAYLHKKVYNAGIDYGVEYIAFAIPNEERTMDIFCTNVRYDKNLYFLFNFNPDELINSNRGECRYYPMLYIPDNTIEYLNKEISDKEAAEYIGLVLPKKKVVTKPNPPSRMITITIPTSEYKLNLKERLVLCVIVIVYLLAGVGSIINNSKFLLWVYIFGFIVPSIIAFIYIFQKKESSKILSTMNVGYYNELKSYNEELKKIAIQEEDLNIKYNEELKIIFKEFKGDLLEGKNAILNKLLLPSVTIKNKPKNIKRGSSEIFFLTKLFEEFGSQILVDRIIDSPHNEFQPDFILKCSVTGLYIDIEIDEPYTFKDNSPIHCDDDDTARNNKFLEWNWCVVRFSERQIIETPDDCVKYIKGILTSIRNKENIKLRKMMFDLHWTYEEALVLAGKKIRTNYRKDL